MLSTTTAIVTREPAGNSNGQKAGATDSAHNERLKRRLSDAEQEPNRDGRYARQSQTSANLDDSGRDEECLS
jgi:hypothetical protein